MRRILHLITWIAAALVSAAQSRHDSWLTNTAPLPVSGIISTNSFATLRADAVAGQLQITWQSDNPLPETAATTVYASAGPAGHWPARDWRARPMHRHGAIWQANIPVESIDTPIAYFAAFISAGLTNVSPVRICHPRHVGLEEPSKFFWPFVEGFELGLESWRSYDENQTLRTASTAKNGRSALAVTISPQKRSAIVGTTRVHGWLVEERAATGLAFWARTQSGTGQLRCTLIANAFSTNQLSDTQSTSFEISAAWKRFTIAFSAFPPLLLTDLDVITFEWIGSPGTVFLLDDIYFLGLWRFE